MMPLLLEMHTWGEMAMLLSVIVWPIAFVVGAARIAKAIDRNNNHTKERKKHDRQPGSGESRD